MPLRRTDALLLAMIALCAAVVALCAPDAGAAPPPLDDDPAPAATTDAPADDGAANAPATGSLAPVASTTRPAPTRVDTTGWTSGIVRGDIQLAVSILDRIQSITVEVVEARSAIGADGAVKLPTRLIATVERGRGTPTFELRDVPFSEHPYVVLVRSPGLNGSRTIVTINAQQPLHEDLVLAITPGVALSLLARDQEMIPYTGLDIALQPLGEPAGRPPRAGRTDNFGSLVLPDMLAGEYELRATQGGALVCDPERVVVQPGNRAAVPGQAHKLIIERGVPVDVTVVDRSGRPIEAVKVTATATDRLKLTVREAASDAGGVARLPLLQGGTWHLTVTLEGFHLWDRQITVTPFQDPIALEARLVPIRR